VTQQRATLISAASVKREPQELSAAKRALEGGARQLLNKVFYRARMTLEGPRIEYVNAVNYPLATEGFDTAANHLDFG
jgi:hypothetical protein